MTNRSEIEALADELCSSRVTFGLTGVAPTIGWTFPQERLHEFARRLQPARVPEGWTILRDGDEISVCAPDMRPGAVTLNPRNVGTADKRWLAVSERLLFALADALLSAAPAPEAARMSHERDWTVVDCPGCGRTLEYVKKEAAQLPFPPAPEFREAVMINGRTTAETSGTASVMGLSPAPETIDLDAEHWKAIQKAASESKWMPQEYMVNDWLSDVLTFLRDGPDAFKPEAVPAFRDRVSEIEDAVAAGTMNAYQCFTQMRQLVVAAAAAPAPEAAPSPTALAVGGEAVSWANADFYAGNPLPVLHPDPETNAEILIQALCDRLDTTRRALAAAAAMQVVQPTLAGIKANAAWAMHETDPRRMLPRSAHPAPESREADIRYGVDHGKPGGDKTVHIAIENGQVTSIAEDEPEAGQREVVEDLADTLDSIADDTRAHALNGEEHGALRKTAEMVRRLASAQQAGIQGEVVEIGDDESGQPRIVIHTTREAIKAAPALLFKHVTVAAGDGKGVGDA